MIIEVYAPGTPSKLMAILQRITSLTEAWILSIYVYCEWIIILAGQHYI